MNKRVSSVYEKFDVSKRNAAEVVDTVFAAVKNTMVAGESIKLVQFGKLNVQISSPRRGRRPRNCECMTIIKRQIMSVRPSKKLRNYANG